MRFLNTLNCNVTMTVGKWSFMLPRLSMWQNIDIPANGKVLLDYEAGMKECDFIHLSHTSDSGVQ